MGRAQNSNDVDDCSDVGTVISCTGSWRSAELRKQVSRRTRGQSRDHALAMLIVEDQLVRVLRQTWHLLRGWLVEALLIQFHVQTSREQRCTLFELLWIRHRSLANRFQVRFQSRAVEADLLQVLRRTNK